MPPTTANNPLTSTAAGNVHPACYEQPSRCRPWLAALSGAFMTILYAFLALGIGGALSGIMGGYIGGAVFLLAMAACAPGLLLFALWNAMSAPIEGPLETALHFERQMQGMLIAGVGSLLFWACLGGAWGYWRCVRKQRRSTS